MTHLELFRCEPLRARLTAKACAQNYLDAQHRRAVRTADQRLVSSRAIGLGPCRECSIGRAHAAGETPDVIMTPAVAPASKEPREEPPMPPTNDLRKRLALDACRRKDRPILEVGREYGVHQATLRKWLKREGHDPKTWPKMRPGPGTRKAPAPPMEKGGDELSLDVEERAAKAAESTQADAYLDEARKVSDALFDVFLGQSHPAPLVVELDHLPHRVALAIRELAQGRLEEAKKHIAAFEVCR